MTSRVWNGHSSHNAPHSLGITVRNICCIIEVVLTHRHLIICTKNTSATAKAVLSCGLRPPHPRLAGSPRWQNERFKKLFRVTAAPRTRPLRGHSGRSPRPHNSSTSLNALDHSALLRCCNIYFKNSNWEAGPHCCNQYNAINSM